ncbi:MAG: hypothetical protein IJU70_02540 [Lentisphaeria bacterium]|nr:hypothetical protein [Lentisphaeria bacterium]
MKMLRGLPQLFLTALLCLVCQSSAGAPPAAPAVGSIDYKLSRYYISGYVVDSCPARKAFALLQGKIDAIAAAMEEQAAKRAEKQPQPQPGPDGKVKQPPKPNFKLRLIVKIPPNQERCVTINAAKRKTLRAVLGDFAKFGYVWSKTGQNITINPVGKASEWQTGFGSMKLMDGNPAWVNRSRVRNVKLENAPFSEVEKLLRAQKYRVSTAGRPQVRLTIAAGNVQLRQFLTAVCMATGWDCEVNNQSIRFLKGSGVGYYPTDPALEKRMVSVKYPVVKHSLPVAKFMQSAHSGTAWVFLHMSGLSLKHYRASVPAEISGIKITDALETVAGCLRLRVLYMSNGVILLIPNPARARAAFAERLKMTVSDLKFDSVPFAKILDEISGRCLASDRTHQGLPVVWETGKPTEPVSMDLPDTQAGELLKRLTLAQGLYGYVSGCGTSYVIVKSGLFSFNGITVKKLSPMVLPRVASGLSRLDVPLDFTAVSFQDVTVENVLKFIKVLNDVRFDNTTYVRWAIDRPTLNRTVSFDVEKPTLRSILDALAVRANLNADFQVKGVYVKNY